MSVVETAQGVTRPVTMNGVAAHATAGGTSWRSPGVLVVIVAAMIGAFGAILGAILDDDNDADPAPPAPPPTSTPGPPADAGTTLSVEPDSGPVGTTVLVSGVGFEPDEPIAIRIAVGSDGSGVEVASTRADAQGGFRTSVPISNEFAQHAPAELIFRAIGETSGREALTTFSLS